MWGKGVCGGVSLRQTKIWTRDVSRDGRAREMWARAHRRRVSGGAVLAHSASAAALCCAECGRSARAVRLWGAARVSAADVCGSRPLSVEQESWRGGV